MIIWIVSEKPLDYELLAYVIMGCVHTTDGLRNVSLDA